MDPTTRNTEVRVVIAEPNGPFKDRVREFLRSQTGLFLVGETAEASAALRFARCFGPDVVVLGWDVVGAIGVLHELASNGAAPRVIVLAGEIARDETLVALRLGARGVVLKSQGPSVLLRAIRAVAGGQYWFGRQSLADAVETLRKFSTAALVTVPRLEQYGLTSRELDIVGAVTAGRGNKEIAQQCAISEKTVKHHLTNIFRKVGVSTRLELGTFAMKHQFGSHVPEGADTDVRPPTDEAATAKLRHQHRRSS